MLGPIRCRTSQHARALRRDRTDAENRFCQVARNRQIDGFKFRFQHSIEPYVADFVCLEAMVIVEIDGSQHDAASDAQRSDCLESRGYLLLRFWNNDVLTNTDGVVEVVRGALIARTPRR